MIGLDANILVRYIVGDDEQQAHMAAQLIESRCTADDPGFVNSIIKPRSRPLTPLTEKLLTAVCSNSSLEKPE